MKAIYSILLFTSISLVNVFIPCNQVSAQSQFTGGPKGGLTLSTFTGADATGSTTLVGFHLGGYCQYAVSDNIALQAELLYCSLGSSVNVNTSITTITGYDINGNPIMGTVSAAAKGSVRLSYLQIPVLFVYKVNNLSFHAGPYLGFLIGAHEHETLTASDPVNGSQSLTLDASSTSGINSTDFGLAIGGNYELESGLNFGVRITKGLTNVNSNSAGGTINNLGFLFSAGYTLGKKK